MVISASEQTVRDEIVARLLTAVRANETVRLPAYDPSLSSPSGSALLSVGIEPNAWGSTVGEFRYQIEGEDDLLHLFVVRQDGGELSPAESHEVAAFLWPGVPRGLLWFKPGALSQHYYVGHDVLLEYL